MNSTSRSIGKQRQSEMMDFVDVDQVLEVPDTPDRLSAAAHSSERNSTEKHRDASTNSRIASKNYVNGSIRNQSSENHKSVRVNGTQRLFIYPEICSNSPVSRLASSCSLKNVRPMVDAARCDKGKTLCNSNAQRSICKEGGSVASLKEQNGHGHSGISRPNTCRKGVLPLIGFPAIDSLDTPNKTCKPNNTLKIGLSSDHGKGVDVVAVSHHKAESNASAFMQPCTSSRGPRQKRLVRNGCISPLNIAKSKNVAEKDETCSVAKEKHRGSGSMASNSPSTTVDIKDLIVEDKDSRRCKEKGVSCHPSSSNSPTTVDIKDLIAEAKDSRRCKGKGVSCHPSSSEEPSARNKHLFHRLDASSHFAESAGWRTTHNHTKERDVEPQTKVMVQKDLRNERDSEHLDESVTHSSQRVYDPAPMVSRPAPKLGIKRQREGTASSHIGDCSISPLDDSAGEPSTSRPKRNKSLHGVGTSNPVPEPNIQHGNNEDSSVKALQVEADERLARELQEQLYNEEQEPAVENNEMDSDLALAMAFNRNNSSRRAGGRHTNRRHGTSTSRAHQHTRLFTSRRHAYRISFQPQARTSSRISSTSTQRNSIFPPNMDVDMRMEILETLEGIGDMRVPSELLQVGREFNEDDYEMLLALDEDNDSHGGATRAQINNLPESTVQAENLQECAICLETPAIGETIRHLPCLHRFHKECIDRWLGRKTSCPVCKSSIT